MVFVSPRLLAKILNCLKIRQMKTDSITVQPDLNTAMPLEFYYGTLGLTSRSNLWRWTKRGLKTQTVGGRVFISQADLQRFMNEEANR